MAFLSVLFKIASQRSNEKIPRVHELR